MKSINFLLIAFIAFASCRTVKKTSSEHLDAKHSFVSAKKDSLTDVKIDGVAVHLGKDSIVYKVDSSFDEQTVIDEVTEFQNGLPSKTIKKTVINSKGNKKSEGTKTSSTFDSSAVHFIDHSAIKEDLQIDDSTIVSEKNKEVNRKVSAWKIAGGLFMFFALCGLIGIVFKHRKTLFPI